ncbi:hypothetical protein SBI_00209 [Streptomyces bingchenggensis BCW-1]|uniref:Uncharacterized protein n=1 Tax=Streptomyces bingchenggensis (strain BCW-1) TaxID=749414 RepID=D7BWH4_STRBB|nr:hypothetical protein SBI_00209 [Streptomyces bingchenggensis BCW-1]
MVKGGDVQDLDGSSRIDYAVVRGRAGFILEEIRGEEDKSGPQKATRMLYGIHDRVLNFTMRRRHQRAESLSDLRQVFL